VIPWVAYTPLMSERWPPWVGKDEQDWIKQGEEAGITGKTGRKGGNNRQNREKQGGFSSETGETGRF